MMESSDSDSPFIPSQVTKEVQGIMKSPKLCTEWNEFYQVANRPGGSAKGNNGMIFGTHIPLSSSDEVLGNLPHCSVGGWTTLTRSKPQHPLFNLPNSFEVGSQIHTNLVDVNPSVLNAVIFFQRGQRELEILRTLRSAISFMRNFIYKISLALQTERDFEIALERRRHADESVPKASRVGGDTDSDFPEAENPPYSWNLPKLGKVYAELRSCIRACDEATGKCSQSSSQAARKLKCQKLQRECSEFQGKMLLHVRWLIEARLHNIGRLVALGYENADFDSDDIFCTNENKRFCKLLELFNEYTTKHLKGICMPEKEIRIIFGDLTQTFSSVNDSPYLQGLGETHSTLRASVIYPLSVGKILDILSKTFMENVGHQVTRILSSCGATQTVVPAVPSHPSTKMTENGFLWEQASKIEIRPMRLSNHKTSFFRVIKRVAGLTVPDINTDKAGIECAELSQQFKKHGKVVSSFVSGLGGKTKILRRSVNLQDPYLSDDAMSVTSSSSRASSSLARYNDIKSVSWKDSWNNEAMKSITSSYLEFLINSIPNCFQIADRTPLHDNGILLEKIWSRQDIDLILLQAVVSNLSYFNVMSEYLHKALLNTSTELLIKAALSCSDSLLCEMLGKTTPPFDKPAIQKDAENPGVSLVTNLCVASLQPLLHVMEFYAKNDTVAKDVLPAVEIILNAGFGWVKRKIQEFFSMWDLQSLLQMCLLDLRAITTVALDSLKLLEACHNHIEMRRNQDSATLLLATKHLHNIDSLITTMQMTSGTSMTQIGKEAKAFSLKLIVNHFPTQKFWIRKNVIDCEFENEYVREIIEAVVKSACSAVSTMSSQCQLAGMTPVVNSVFEACLAHIAKSKTKFSMQGAMQLYYDFSTIINFVTADISGLSHETRTALSSLHSVKHAIHIAQLLQSTTPYNDSVDERFRPQSTGRTASSSTSYIDIEDEEPDDKFWLSLRKSNMKRSKTWTSFIPCMDEN